MTAEQPLGPASETLTVRIPMTLAKAWRWKRMLEGGGYASIGDLAKAEKVNFSFLCRVLRLGLLPPALVEAVLQESNSTTSHGWVAQRCPHLPRELMLHSSGIKTADQITVIATAALNQVASLVHVSAMISRLF